MDTRPTSPSNSLDLESIEFHPLARRTCWVPEVTRWLWEEWGHLAPEANEEWVRDRVAERLNTDTLPIIFVATAGHGAEERPIATASIKLRELAIRPSLLNWLGSVYTVPAARGNGVATALCAYAAEWADRIGVPELYLYTSASEQLYARLGWEVAERGTLHGESIAVMVRASGAALPAPAIGFRSRS